MEIAMITNLLKALLLTTLAVVTPSYAEEPVSYTHEYTPEIKVEIAAIDSDELIKSIATDKVEASRERNEEAKNATSIKPTNNSFAEIKQVIENLAATQWDNLNAYEKQELLSKLGSVNNGMAMQINHGIPNTGSDAMPIIAIIAVFGTPLFITFGVLYYQQRKRLIKVALVKDYLDAGKDVPSEVLVAINGPASDAPASSLDGAVRNISIGLGLFLALSLLADWSLATVALIPLFIGIGKLIVWRMNKDSADI